MGSSPTWDAKEENKMDKTERITRASIRFIELSYRSITLSFFIFVLSMLTTCIDNVTFVDMATFSEKCKASGGSFIDEVCVNKDYIERMENIQ